MTSAPRWATPQLAQTAHWDWKTLLVRTDHVRFDPRHPYYRVYSLAEPRLLNPRYRYNN